MPYNAPIVSNNQRHMRPKDIRKELENEKHIHRTKSLTVWQLEKLSQILREGITKDGRYCALAIMLYTGARPAEVRALRWGDLVPFLDHPDHLLMRLCRTLDSKGRPKATMKTTDAYRSIQADAEYDGTQPSVHRHYPCQEGSHALR